MSIVRKRDNQKGRLYSAERGAFIGFHRSVYSSDEAIQKYVDKIVNSSWWKKHTNISHVIVDSGKKRAGADAWREYRIFPVKGKTTGVRNEIRLRIGRIRFAPGLRNHFVALHELSHIVIYDIQRENKWTDHGPEFAKVYLALVHKFLGKHYEDNLKESFKRHKVSYRSSFKVEALVSYNNHKEPPAKIIIEKKKSYRFTAKVSDALDCLMEHYQFSIYHVRFNIRQGRVKPDDIYKWMKKLGYEWKKNYNHSYLRNEWIIVKPIAYARNIEFVNILKVWEKS